MTQDVIKTYEAIIANMAKLLEVQQSRESVVMDMVAEAIKVEREACAKVCEEQYEYYGHDHVFAKAIRARGQA
jgi:hypothetical protein